MNETRFHWAGLDVAKKSFDAAVVFYGQHYPETKLHEVPCKTFERSPDGVKQLLAWLDEQLPPVDDSHPFSVRAVMESTGKYSQDLALWLLQQTKEPVAAIVNPGLTANFIKSMGLRNKTDRLEARALAFYGVERRPAPYKPLTLAHSELRELSRLRDSFITERVACKNRGEHESPNTFVRKTSTRRIRELNRHIDAIENRIKKLIIKDEALNHDYEILNTIPGVNFVTAAVILAELGDLRRFERARQISAFAGLSPRIHDSGSSVKGKQHMCKFGNRRVRQALYLSAVSAMRFCPSLRKCYQRLLLEGKSKMNAIGAVMRKLLVLMRALLIADEPYNPEHCNGGKTCGKPTASCG
jgi:transposase